MPGLDDYGALLRSGSAAVPDYAAQEAQRQMQNLQITEARQKLAETQREIADQQSFQSDLTTVLAHPSPQAYSALALKHPKYMEPIKTSFEMQDKAKQDSDLQAMSEVYSAAANGKPELAGTLMQRRVDADKAAGQDTTHDQAILDAFNSGDPVQQKGALGMVGVSLSAIRPEKFAETLGQLTKDKGYTLGPGDKRFDDSNKEVASVDAKPDFLVVPEGGKAIPLNSAATAVGTGGGGQSSPGVAPTTAPGGFDHAVATVLHNEGGYSPKDMNGSPVNFGINQKANPGVDVKNLTADQAKQIYHDKYWVPSGAEQLPANMQTPYFDVYVRNPQFAKAALAKSNGDPQQFMALASNYFQKLAAKPGNERYAAPYANRDANNTALATAAPAAQSGGIPGTVYGNSKPQARVLTAAEAQAKGLDTSKIYELRPDGTVSSVGDADSANSLPGDTTKQGPAYLASLPPASKAIGQQAKLLTEGRLGTISSFALAKPYWQKILQVAVQYDHTFDMNMAPARKAAITAFTGTGKGAMLVGSINRVANHMQLLWNESSHLAGPDTGFGPLDTVLATSGQAFERPHAKAYDTEVTFVAGELGKLAKAGVVTEGEVDKIINNLDRRNAEVTRKSAIQAAVGIISGAVDPLKDQYNSAFTNGSSRPSIPWVTPKAQQIFKQIGGVDLSLTGEGAGGNAPAANSSRQPPQGATKTATGPNGQKAALVNGHWVQY